MKTNPLLYGIIGFLLGGLVVSLAATFDKPAEACGDMVTELTQKTSEIVSKAL